MYKLGAALIQLVINRLETFMTFFNPIPIFIFTISFLIVVDSIGAVMGAVFSVSRQLLKE